MRSYPPPSDGSSRAALVYGGAERGISLATGFFTGEATWKPLGLTHANSRLEFRGLGVGPLTNVDSTAESIEATTTEIHQA